MKILVTGSEGYIGSNLVSYLLGRDYEVICVDEKLGIGAEDWTYFDNVDFVVHLAAISGISDCSRDIDRANRCNILTTTNIAKYCSEENIPVIFSSSGAAKNPESSFYALTKYVSEKILFHSSQKNICLRFTNVYGGVNYIHSKNSVIAKFIRAKINGERFKVHGDGLQLRDFIHVIDICKVIEKLFYFKGDISEPIDVGTGIGTSINQVCEIFNKKPIYIKTNPGVDSSIANIKNLQKIGYIPEPKLEKYLKSLNLI